MDSRKFKCILNTKKIHSCIKCASIDGQLEMTNNDSLLGNQYENFSACRHKNCSIDIKLMIYQMNYKLEKNCDFLFLNPMPDQNTLNKIYTEEDTKTKDGYKKASSRLRRAFIKLPRFLPYAINKNCMDN